jgi:hypothetical protein
MEAGQTEYKRIRSIVERETRRINGNSWNTYISNIQYDVHGNEETAYKILRELNKTERDKIQLNPIPKNE